MLTQNNPKPKVMQDFQLTLRGPGFGQAGVLNTKHLIDQASGFRVYWGYPFGVPTISIIVFWCEKKEKSKSESRLYVNHHMSHNLNS